MFAPARMILWLAFFVGLAMDLISATTRRGGGGEPGVAWLLGPQAIGYLAGIYVVLRRSRTKARS